ncbi:TPA: hypothetical protein ACK11I_000448 [Pseudomonas aeruginosa]
MRRVRLLTADGSSDDRACQSAHGWFCPPEPKAFGPSAPFSCRSTSRPGHTNRRHAMNPQARTPRSAPQAETFAKGLPPASLDLSQEGEDPHYIDMTLDFLVDELADAMHAERKVRAAFNRDIGNKVLFIKDSKLLFIKGIKLKAIADRKAYVASLRARQAPPIVILAELPPEQAFDLWKQHVLGDKPD